jgi:uncharacterized phage protein (TIGR02218 family)
MRTALWETSTGALAALLNSGAPLNKADLYTLTLGNGTVFRWSGADVALTGNGHTWVLGPGLNRSRLRQAIGVSVDDMKVTITDNVGTLINGQKLMAFIRAGGFVGARMQVDRAFWGRGDTQPVGALMWFAGTVSVPGGDRRSGSLTIESDLNRLSIMVPGEVYQTSCRNTVYDSACTKKRSDYVINAAATSATDATRITFSHTMVQAAGYFELGTITMTSGANAGIARSVKTQTTGSLTVLNPWPFPVASGDTFSVVPGCDGSQTTCTTKFSNVINFRGHPYIPVPQTAV